MGRETLMLRYYYYWLSSIRVCSGHTGLPPPPGTFHTHTEATELELNTLNLH